MARARRTPGDLERETGARGRRDLRRRAARAARDAAPRPGNTVRGARGLWLVGGTAHPGGGLPIVALGGATVARAIGDGV